MLHKRFAPNAVLLPDASVIVFGGQSDTEGHILEAERYTLGGTWQPMASASSARSYHSTAVLLPSAKVLLGGSDDRTWDYEIYNPPYLFCGPRPTWVSPKPGGSTGVLNYNTLYTAYYDLEPPATVQKVVLMRPGALTHHYDSDQRYVQLTVQPPPGSLQIQFWTPLGIPQKNSPNTPSENRAPKGWYMMFLVTNAGVPSVAHWVKLQ